MIENRVISVIIPVYNAEQYLYECLNSVINQSYKNLEIILVDDGSMDKSFEICDKFALQDSRIKVLHQKNGGVSVARNSGLDIATGEFVTFVDSDDMIDKEHIANMLNLFDENIDIVCMPLETDGLNFSKKELDAISAFKYILYEKENWFGWSNCNKLFRRDILKDIRYLPDEKVGEDFSFIYKVILNSKKIVFGNKKTYNYRVSDTSVMRSSFDERHRTLLVVCDRFIKYVKDKDIDLLDEAYYFKANRLILLLLYARKNNDIKSDIKFVKTYSNELKKIKKQIYKNKFLGFKFKFKCFLHANFAILLYARYKLKIFLKSLK
ncbi:glycosyltransferase [Campylobacter sp. VBCF_06 NA8]|uniref:glycosyltransferase family 2 protein n=1 Tax=Campylobacter sp. VBCF_06 NA8 TaxID=2983822 RepID=UPI0022E9A99B|nr:glycosyltransferase family 2 protein [Campylobacter sp. VBCF_06 NA8]MDA3046665.1 glycosyltransferase [Campylobacter sp. VBCF_06 NA8]